MIIKIDDKKVHYEIKGEGEPILFVHGWGGSIESLKGLSDLASKDFQTIIFDLPGFGKSDMPDPDWGVEEYSNFVVQFIKKMDLGKINYFGHSFGGSLGIYITVHYPTLINKLILCAPSYKRENKTSKLSIYRPLFKKLQPKIKKLIYRVLFPQSDLYKFPELESNFRKIVTQDMTKYLEQVKVKTLILWGDQDLYTSVILARELHEKIKNSELKIYPNISHNLPISQPVLVYDEIRKFI